MQAIQDYLNKLNQRYQTGISREHAYRGDLQNLLETMLPDILVTNEPAHIACGAPDYILTKNNIPVGYIEAKDIGKALNSKDYKEQFDRYKKSLANLIITDYLNFEFYKEGQKVAHTSLAEIADNKLQATPESFGNFKDLIQDFAAYIGQTIKSPTKLSGMMVGKAKLLANIIERSINSDEQNHQDSSLKQQMRAFKAILIHDINAKQFADVYAQTIAYGMFAARLHDQTLSTFSRQEAAELIPKTNPFLRSLFQYIAGYDLDERIVWIVDSLADIFRATDVAAILNNFGKATRQNDPIIHFYETFLAEYDPKLRKSRGVWYTPEPVVNFIVRAVDELLKTEFKLPKGLADSSKTTIELDTQFPDRRSKTGYRRGSKEVHKVQVLDPATGTGTFLAETVKHIYQDFKGQQGIWSGYVEEHLIPRLNGFELLMASYAMAHLKLDLLLKETGYIAKKQQRLNVFLTNSLEKEHPDTGTLFATWLSSEASEANRIKRDAPVMVVMGNPPYAVSSSNKGDWIQELIKDYKKDLNERNIQPLSDDYIKFIRYGQHYIDKNGEGILAYISNNSFIDGIIHRQMRKSLLESFDKIYIIDLHGSSKKKETAPDGSKDENVFDIMQGVSINLFIKTSGSKDLAEVYHLDVYGKRQGKYQLLYDNTLESLEWNQLDCRAPEYFFVPKDFAVQKSYNKGFSVNELFSINSSGIKTHRDHFVIGIDKNELEQRIQYFLDRNNSESDIISKLGLKETASWKVASARDGLEFKKEKILTFLYRPFDIQYIYYDSCLIDRGREKFMQHLQRCENLGLIVTRQLSTFNFQHIFVTEQMIDGNMISLQTKEYGYTFPLYLYPEPTNQQSTEISSHRIPNLSPDIVKQIEEQLALIFTDEKQGQENTFAPIDLLDYIYAVLHSPTYRDTYQEFLKIDFPRVPYPEKNTFWQLVSLGAELRQIHLLESPVLDKPITRYPQDGDNIIHRKINKADFELDNADSTHGRIWINDQQYFADIPLIAWEFYIGGYQPAQKWLKDRCDRTLDFEDILHYQKIIVALAETHRIMQEIDQEKGRAVERTLVR